MSAAFPRLPRRWLEKKVTTILRSMVMYEPLAACVFFFRLRRKAKARFVNKGCFILKLPIAEPHNLIACDVISTTHDSRRCRYMKLVDRVDFDRLGGRKCASAIYGVGSWRWTPLQKHKMAARNCYVFFWTGLWMDGWMDGRAVWGSFLCARPLSPMGLTSSFLFLYDYTFYPAN